ncbi:MAG: sigma-70 family RNA polymerase sigma factor [Actinobacteria bacterium]|nr:MAG: sigma-70 family RNA polymerase sigma factor [Actinomycetota bacterium]TMM10408.1 MAG: sigma-70 family RNA polymerase sigma factor [Actinomycetota bacterium]
MTLPPFQALLDDHAEAIHRFLVGLVGPAEAEDCFQETFLAALRSYTRLREGSNLRAWLFTVARSKAMDAHRRSRRAPVPVAEPPEPRRSGNGGHGVEPVDGDLWAAVAALPEKQRAAVVLRFTCDLSHREIGRVLDCSDDAARRSVHEGVKRLREVWA